MRRRTFLLAVTGGLGWAAWHGVKGLLPSEGEGALSAREGARDMPLVKRSGLAFGTVVTIGVVHANPTVADRAIASAFEEIRLIERVMSLFREDSDIGRLNRNGLLHRPHPYLYEVVEQAQALAARTDGAFDITIQNLWRLHAESWRASGPPHEEQLSKSLARVGWRHLSASRELIALDRPGMAITLNGIAQGYAVDRAMARMREHGIQNALLDTGEFGGIGSKREGVPWKVGIQDPRQEETSLAVVYPRDCYLATSGDYMTSFSPDLKHHHILDPRTGVSPSELASVTVAADTGMLADGLATALFVLGTEKGLALLQRFPKAEAFLVRKDGSTAASAGFQALLSPLAVV